MGAIESKKIGEIYGRKYMQRNYRINECDDQKQILDWVVGNWSDMNVNILDAGCGSGKYSNYLYSKGFKNVYAIDLFDRSPVNNGIRYAKCSIDCTPFHGDSFDLVISLSVIYYLNNPERGLQEFNRLLKKGGLLIMTAHTKYSLFTLWRIIKRIVNSRSVEHLQNVKFYSANEYCKMLKSSGFEVEYVDGFRLSLLNGKVYSNVRRLAKKVFNKTLPCWTMKRTNNKAIKIFRATFGYHSVIVAVKR
jgi:SAM-dependent methyltransferase